MTTGAGYRGYAIDDLVTGEGVAVELPIAGLPARIGSGLIDLVVAVAALWLGSLAVAVVGAGSSEAVGATLAIVLVVGVTVALPATVETLSRGRTLGKLALGLRVVRDDGGPITVRHALTRALVGFVEIYLFWGAGALVSAIISPRVKRLGDMAAGTYVVTQRASMRLLPPPAMPAPLAAWAVGADIAPLPPGLAIAIRQFLGRAAALTPASRAQIGEELYRAVRPLVAPDPPGLVHHELVLAAVVAERRRRDADRLAREDARRAALLPPDALGG